MTRLSLRAAINQKCRECIHDPFGGTGQWRESVEACSSSNCPLHAVRPRSKGERVKAVSSRKDAQNEPDPPTDAEPDISVLLGGLFHRDGAVGG